MIDFEDWASHPTDNEVADLISILPPHFTTFWSGNGGYATFGGVNLKVIKWTRRPANRKADTTASDTAGWQRKQNTLYGYQGTITVLWDSDALPFSTGIIQGATGTLVLALGNSGQTTSGPVVIDGPGEECDNQNGVVTYELAWESIGAWTTP